ncbi:MAG TPA: outer membrane protein transport protein [Vicinamibacteria bacterium]|nr:outer membrane protein transport protein [Vicinamibacteria bacterium]
MSKLGSFVLVAFVFSWVSDSRAQGIVFPSAGATHRSMAGASTAAPFDAAGAVYWNPAAMAAMVDGEIFVGVDFVYGDTYLDSSVESTGQFGSNRSDSGLAAAPAFGVVSRPENSSYTYGLGVYGLVGRTIDFPASEFNPVLKPFDPPRSFGLGPVSSRVSGLQIAPVMSKDVSETLSVGVGAQVTSMFLALDPALFAERNPGGLFPPATQGRSYWGAGFQLGVLYRPGTPWSFGASYKSPQWFERFDYNSKDEKGNPRQLSLELQLPWIVSLGAAYHGFEDTVLAVDVRYFDYANTKLFGTTPANDGLGWKSIWAIAVGAKRPLSSLIDVQAGFSWNGNPIPDAATLFNIQLPAVNELAFSGGLTVALTERVDIVGSVVYALRHTNRGTILEIPGTAIELGQDLATFSLGFAFRL